MNPTEYPDLSPKIGEESPEIPAKSADFADPGEKNRVIGGTLYLVATPIGNLSDLSERAIKVLREVDFIAAEDTRNSLKLLTHFGIRKPLISYFEHNKAERGPAIAARLREGQSCALITDAGTPAISDPGEDLVRLCAAEGIPVSAIPGCCAAITALTLSGLPTRRFVFEGFLEGSKSQKRARLAELADEKRTLILYEAPHRLTETLADLAELFGDRQIALCRELTKRNEEIVRTRIPDAAAFYRENAPRGEYVLIVEGAAAARGELFWQGMSVPEHIESYEKTGLTRMDAIKRVARDRRVGKSVIYRQAVESAGEGENDNGQE